MKNRSSAPTLFRNRLLYSTALCLAALIQQDAWALPQGGNVVGGAATITQPASNQLDINQTTNRAIINWNSFNIGTGEGTTFYQPSASSIALNRVTGSTSPTQILGNLTANGQVAIINPNGVIFEKGSQVNVGSLIATSNDISNANAMAGNLNFNIAGNANAGVVNQGTITAAQAGLVALVAPSVRNDGVINAKLGTVALGAGNGFALDLNGDGLYSLAVTAPAAQANITNTGNIAAQGGHVLLTANAAAGVLNDVINNSGLISATTASTGQNGEIILDGGTTGAVTVAGTLDASGKSAGQTGGLIEVLGDNITIASGALLDASGAAGGGHVAIGGIYDDTSMTFATNVNIAQGSTINVSALQNGNGGLTEIVTRGAGATTTFAGTVLGKGAGTGAGGQTKMDALTPKGSESDPARLAYLDSGSIDNSAPIGQTGVVVADPLEWTIWNGAGDSTHINAASIESVLNNGTNFISQSDQKYTVSSAVNWTGTGSLTLITGGDMFVNAGLQSLGSGALTLAAAHSLTMTGSTVKTNTGNINIDTGDISMQRSSITAQNALLNVNNSGIFSSDAAGVLNVGASDPAQLIVHQNAGGSLQNTLDAIGTVGTGGAEAILGSGIFTGPVTIKTSNLLLEGNGINNTFIEAATGNAPVITVTKTTGTVISNLSVDGGNTAGSIGIAFNSTTGGGMQNSVVRNAATGVSIFGDTGLQLIANDFNHDTTKAVDAFNSANMTAIYNTVDGGSGGIAFNNGNINLLGNNFVGTNGDAINLTYAPNSLIDSNTIGGGGGINVHSSSDYTIIRNNNLFGLLHDGIDVSSSTVQVLGNTVAGAAGKGIAVNDGANSLVQGNTVNFSGNNAIDVTGTIGVTVSSNNITGTTAGSGISLTDSVGGTINNNNISNAATSGIFVSGTDNVTIAGNATFGGVTGINVSGGQNGALTGNDIYYAAGKGVTIDSTTGMAVTGNGVSSVGGDAFTFTNTVALTANNNTVGGGKGAGIVVSGGNQTKLTNNTIFSNSGDGIDIAATGLSSVTGNNISGTGGKGININGDLAVVSNNTVSFTGDTGIALTNSLGSSVTGNTIVVTAKGDGISISNSASAVVENNSVASAYGADIRVGTNLGGTTINTNTLFGGSTGIISTAANGIINGNTIYYTKGDGIDASGNAVKVSNNTVAANGGKGIVVTAANTALIDGNTLEFNGGDAINVSGSLNATISNNSIVHPGGNGIVLGAGSSQSTIELNRLTQVAGTPIVVDASDIDVTVKDNTIY